MEKEEFYRRVYNYGFNIIQLVQQLSKDQVGQVLGNQLLRSGTSVSANLVEAKSASSKKDYINFYTHALKSANESKLWLNYLKDSGKTNKDQEKLIQETGEIANILAASILTMKNKRKI